MKSSRITYKCQKYVQKIDEERCKRVEAVANDKLGEAT